MTEPTLHGRHILVVEDEFLLADDMAQTLELEGAVVIGPVASVDEALTLVLSRARIDIALLDVNLGGTLAFPVADALTDRGVLLAFTTGYDEWTIPTRFAAVPRLEKPFSAALLLTFLSGVQ